MIELRRASEEDLDWIASLEESSFSAAASRETLSAQLSDGRHIFLIASLDGLRAGYMSFDTVLDECYVDNVCTAPEYRRRGVASALVSAACAAASDMGCSFITLEVRASNNPAISLYERQGFRRVGLRPGYYERPREDAVIMTFDFKEA